MAGNAHDFLLPTILVLATMLLVFGMKYLSGVRQARLRFANDDQLRALTENAAAAHSATTASLAAAQGELAEMKARLAAIEKMLREVG